MSTETISQAETSSQAISQAHQTPKPDDDQLSLVVSLRQPAGSQYSPAGDLFAEDAVMRFERLVREEERSRLAAYRRALNEFREREIEARGRVELLERTLADVYERQRFQHSVSAGLAVALVLSIFALLA